MTRLWLPIRAEQGGRIPRLRRGQLCLPLICRQQVSRSSLARGWVLKCGFRGYVLPTDLDNVGGSLGK